MNYEIVFIVCAVFLILIFFYYMNQLRREVEWRDIQEHQTYLLAQVLKSQPHLINEVPQWQQPNILAQFTIFDGQDGKFLVGDRQLDYSIDKTQMIKVAKEGAGYIKCTHHNRLHSVFLLPTVSGPNTIIIAVPFDYNSLHHIIH
jgi:hypothetical protein